MSTNFKSPNISCRPFRRLSDILLPFLLEITRPSFSRGMKRQPHLHFIRFNPLVVLAEVEELQIFVQDEAEELVEGQRSHHVRGHSKERPAHLLWR